MPLLTVTTYKQIAQQISNDLSWANVALLMHGDGANGSTTILDEVGNTYTSSGAIIDNGSLTGGPKFGTGCIKTNGQLIASANDVRFDLAARNFCFEFFLYRTASMGGGTNPIFVKDDGGAQRSYALYANNDRFFFQYFPGGGALYSPNLPLNQWTHVALVRNGTTLTWYMNGVASTTLNYGSGAFATASTPFKVCSGGSFYLDEIRITLDNPRYTANFAVPTTPFTSIPSKLLMHFDNSLTDSYGHSVDVNNNITYSTSVLKFGSHSAVFNGTNSYFHLSSTNDFAFGTGDFTIEFWMRIDATNKSYGTLVDFRTAQPQAQPCICFFNNGKINYVINSSAMQISSSTLSTGVWYHVAVSRASGTTRMFLNGNLQGSVADTNDIVATGAFVGCNYMATGDAQAFFGGNLDELRISPFARYTTTFTPSAAPYTA